MPARHDILCGTLDFLWRPWGSIEIWEEPITAQLRRAGVTTMLVSDHPHLFETGGENYHTDFSAWDYVRGHEGDPWRTFPDPTRRRTGAAGAVGAGSGSGSVAGAPDRPYDLSRTFFRAEEDFPGPPTMRTAADWLRRGAPADRTFLLVRRRVRPARAVRHARALGGPLRPRMGGRCRSGLPTTSARWRRTVERARRPAHPGQLRRQAHHDRPLGRRGLRRVTARESGRPRPSSSAPTTATTWEKDIWGKPGVMQYEPLGHTPLLVHWPGVRRRSVRRADD